MSIQQQIDLSRSHTTLEFVRQFSEQATTALEIELFKRLDDGESLQYDTDETGLEVCETATETCDEVVIIGTMLDDLEQTFDRSQRDDLPSFDAERVGRDISKLVEHVDNLDVNATRGGVEEKVWMFENS